MSNALGTFWNSLSTRPGTYLMENARKQMTQEAEQFRTPVMQGLLGMTQPGISPGDMSRRQDTEATLWRNYMNAMGQYGGQMAQRGVAGGAYAGRGGAQVTNSYLSAAAEAQARAAQEEEQRRLQAMGLLLGTATTPAQNYQVAQKEVEGNTQLITTIATFIAQNPGLLKRLGLG